MALNTANLARLSGKQSNTAIKMWSPEGQAFQIFAEREINGMINAKQHAPKIGELVTAVNNGKDLETAKKEFRDYLWK